MHNAASETRDRVWHQTNIMRKVPTDKVAIVTKSASFSHRDACRLFELARTSTAQILIVDLHEAVDTDTAALARLILLRRRLLRVGRDLRISGMRDRVANLYHIARLDQILPCA